MNTIIKKSFRDFLINRSQTIGLIFALVLANWGIGTISYTWWMTREDMRSNYLQTRPASLILTVDSLSDSQISEMKNLPYVEDIEVRYNLGARIKDEDGGWMPLRLFVVPNFEAVKMSTFSLAEGNWPKEGEIAIERDGLHFLDENKARSVQFRKGQEVVIRQKGVVHDPALASSRMEHVLYGYVTLQTAQNVGILPSNSRLLIAFDATDVSTPTFEAYKQELTNWLITEGINIHQIYMPTPGEHPHQNLLSSLLFLQAGMGGLALVLSCILLINIFQALISRQLPEIGIAKTLGAQQKHIWAMNLGGVLVLSLIGLIIGLPLAYISALAYSGFIARLLNFDLLHKIIPFWLQFMVIATGVLFPLLAGMIPILKGSRITVRSALHMNHYGLTQSSQGLFRKWQISPFIKLILNDLMRNRSRVVLTLLALTTGVALFLLSFHLKVSLQQTVLTERHKQVHDMEVYLDKAYPAEQLTKALEGFSGIDQLTFLRETSFFLKVNGQITADECQLLALADVPASHRYTLLEGEMPQDWTERIIVNQQFVDRYETTIVGDTLMGENEAGEKQRWVISGIVREIGVGSRVLTTLSALERQSSIGDRRNQINITLNSPALSNDRAFREQLENTLLGSQIRVVHISDQETKHQIIADHLSMMIFFLIAIAGLVWVVGGLGVATFIQISLFERMREIGIMKTLGGENPMIIQGLIAEVLLIGLIGWILGSLIAFPLGKMMSQFFGELILHTPLDYHIDYLIIGWSLPVVCLIICLFSWLPIRKGLQKPVGEAVGGITR